VLIPDNPFDPDLDFSSVEVPEFEFATDSVAACYRILPYRDTVEIEKAAFFANQGMPFQAERCRRFAGYDGLSADDKGDK
jgi:hypothetical protein